MKTNDLKKGTQVRLRNGNLADLMDNARGNVRMAKVYGQVEECGSIYSYDIVAYKKTNGDKWEWAEDIEYTSSQLKSAKNVQAIFGGSAPYQWINPQAPHQWINPQCGIGSHVLIVPDSVAEFWNLIRTRI